MADATVSTENTAPKALDVPTTDIEDLVTVNKDGYYEDENHRPEPLYQYGTLDTSDTAGGAHQNVKEISPVFEEARLTNLATAAKALDPEDPTPAELVTLPTGSVTVTGSVRTAEEARDEIAAQLKAAADDPFVLGGPGEQQRLAAEEGKDTGNPDELPREKAAANPAPATATTAESSGTAATNRARAGAQARKA